MSDIFKNHHLFTTCMQSDLEQCIDEKLPVVKQETGLSEVVDKASPMEVGIAQFVSWYVIGMHSINFGVGLNDRQEKRIKAQLFLFGEHNIAARMGLSVWFGTEIGILLTASCIYSIPVSFCTYFGMKALTNYAGYRYYRRQNEKHEKSTALQNF